MGFKIVKKTTNVKNRIYDIINKITGYDLDEPVYENADNYRYCEVGDIEAEKIYESQVEYGCCGFYDSTVVFRGKTYKIGFNYGH